MVEFVGLLKVKVKRGTSLAVRDVVTSDPYVVVTLGQQVGCWLAVLLAAFYSLVVSCPFFIEGSVGRA